jgi:hypothetical protein
LKGTDTRTGTAKGIMTGIRKETGIGRGIDGDSYRDGCRDIDIDRRRASERDGDIDRNRRWGQEKDRGGEAPGNVPCESRGLE